MEYKEIKELSATELNKKKSGLVQELFDARIKNKLGQLGNPLEIRHIRKNIARLNTALVQKVAK